MIAWVLFGLSLVLLAISIYEVRRDLTRHELLSQSTAVLVWSAYIVHGTGVLWAALRRLWPIPLPEITAHCLGGVLIIVGAVIVFAAVWEFRSLARVSGRRADKLVTTGPYRYSRNPQNIGWFLGLLGIAVYGRSGASVLIAVLLLVAFRAYVPIEEQYLARLYGSEWRLYRQHTPRFVGLATVDAKETR